MIVIDVTCIPAKRPMVNAFEREAREIVPRALKALAVDPSQSTPARVFSFPVNAHSKDVPAHDVVITIGVYTGEIPSWKHDLPQQLLERRIESAFKRIHPDLRIRVLLTSGANKGALRVGPLPLNTHMHTGYLSEFDDYIDSLIMKKPTKTG